MLGVVALAGCASGTVNLDYQATPSPAPASAPAGIQLPSAAPSTPGVIVGSIGNVDVVHSAGHTSIFAPGSLAVDLIGEWSDRVGPNESVVTGDSFYVSLGNESTGTTVQVACFEGEDDIYANAEASVGVYESWGMTAELLPDLQSGFMNSPGARGTSADRIVESRHFTGDRQTCFMQVNTPTSPHAVGDIDVIMNSVTKVN